MIGILVVYLVVMIIVIYLLNGKELFTTPVFTRQVNSEFRGINLLGVNSNDGHFACQKELSCAAVCDRNTECKGYSFYKTGQRCYLFGSGGFVPGRPGFFSGKKIDN